MNSDNTVNETILIQSLKRNNCENILGRTGLVWKAILEAMAIASQSEMRSGKLWTEDEILKYDTKQKIEQHNLNNIISDEYGNRINVTYLNPILTISSSEDDFLNKVNYGITECGTSVSEKNNNLIRKYYKENKSTEGPQPGEWNYRDSGKTLKEITLNYVEYNGPLSSTEIRKFMYEMTHPNKKYNSLENRGWYSSYFSDSWQQKAHFSRPSRNDNRILTKTESGKYTIKKV